MLLFFLLFNPFVLILISVIILFILIKKDKQKKEALRRKDYEEYMGSTYYQATKYPYESVMNDAGRYGEYLTYKELRCYEQQGSKLLFNLYVPKWNGETSEIDVVMINAKGLFVFESKNFSGWIFGREQDKNWCQVLKGGEKIYFNNPIVQNRTHLKYLARFLRKTIPMHSIIVFSERCTLKNITINTTDIKVVNRYNLKPAITVISRNLPDVLTEADIEEIYKVLFSLGQTDQATKDRHIKNIRNQQGVSPEGAVPVPIPMDVCGVQNQYDELTKETAQGEIGFDSQQLDA